MSGQQVVALQGIARLGRAQVVHGGQRAAGGDLRRATWRFWEVGRRHLEGNAAARDVDASPGLPMHRNRLAAARRLGKAQVGPGTGPVRRQEKAPRNQRLCGDGDGSARG